jgi:hypothetical protein
MVSVTFRLFYPGERTLYFEGSVGQETIWTRHIVYRLSDGIIWVLWVLQGHIPEAIRSQKNHINGGLIFNGYGDVGI